MKTLKLDHKLAQLVRSGAKTSTWRLFDDKNLSVDDNVQLIDKVDSDQPDTWQVIGAAHINKVIEKKLGDIVVDDMDGHERFASIDEMITTYQNYYGHDVSIATKVKILHFSFEHY
jgi:hypothetical protein